MIAIRKMSLCSALCSLPVKRRRSRQLAPFLQLAAPILGIGGRMPISRFS